MSIFFMVMLITTTANAGDILKVRIVKRSGENREIEVLSGEERGRQLVHHKQTVRCNKPSLISQKLELARALNITKEIAVFEKAQNDILSGNIDNSGQCNSFAYKYGIVDLRQYSGGFCLYVETPNGSYVGKLAHHPDEPASYSMILKDGSLYKKGLSGNRDDEAYALSDLLDDYQGSFSLQMNASIY